MENIIQQAYKLHLWSPLDVNFARILNYSSEYAMILASACLSANTSIGYSCLPLEMLMPEKLFNNCYPKLAMLAWEQAGSPSLEDWKKLLLMSKIVSDGSYPTPIVLDNNKLYLHRMWKYECTVAHFLNKQYLPKDIKKNKISKVLNILLSHENNDDDKINWQKIAVIIAITRQIAFISVMSNIKKYSIMIKLLTTLILINDKKMHIAITAFTKQAISRLNYSLNQAIKILNLNEKQKQQFPIKVDNLCKLFETHYNDKTTYNYINKLNLDILIIDEASMLTLPIMSNIISSLPQKTHIFFFGDCFQLSSVKPGAIWRDIYKHTNNGYNNLYHYNIKQFTNYKLPIIKNDKVYNIFDSLYILNKNYHFNNFSEIEKLANNISIGDINSTLIILHSKKNKNINYMQIIDQESYLKMIEKCASGYNNYLCSIYKLKTPKIILNIFNRYRLLCVLNYGPFGVVDLNNHIEKTLSINKLIQFNNKKYKYVGRPIMILQDIPYLNLENGDVGILLLDKQKELRAYFLLPDNDIKTILFDFLPQHKTAFVVTVNKSQHIEFDHTVLILPIQNTSILTRELLYTAITRTRRKLSIYSTDNVIANAIANSTKSYNNGLFDKLNLV